MVEKDELRWANGLISAATSVARLVGPAAGGALYAVGGAGLAFGVNAVSFGMSALLTWSVRGIEFSAPRTSEAEEPLSAFEGFRVIARDRFLLWITIAWTRMWFAMNVAFVADPPLAKHFGVGAFGLGLIDTALGVGALFGSLAAAKLLRRGEYFWVTVGCLGVAIGWGLIAITPLFALVLVGSAIAAALDAAGMVAGYSLIQE